MFSRMVQDSQGLQVEIQTTFLLLSFTGSGYYVTKKEALFLDCFLHKKYFLPELATLQ